MTFSTLPLDLNEGSRFKDSDKDLYLKDKKGNHHKVYVIEYTIEHRSNIHVLKFWFLTTAKPVS